MNNEVSAAAAEESEEAERSESQGEEFCEESRIPKTKRSSHEPTNEEIRIHEVTHVPYRSWCPCCVAGRGKSDFHLKRDEEDKAVAGVHVDYWFLRDEKGGESTPVLVAKDDSTKAFSAHIAFQKGNVEWVADRVVEDIDKFGHSANVCLKSDQELALVDLVKAIKDKRKGETMIEHSKVYDSQSNGLVERAIQTVEGLTRTLKMSLERKINKCIPSRHPIMTWLIEHVADLLSKYGVGKDGRTAYERIRGKRYHGEMIEFGRRIFHMNPGKPQGGSMKERWSEGTFVGKRFSSDEYMVVLDDGKLIKARSVKLLPESQSWNAGVLENLTSTPWKEQAVKEETEVIHKTVFAEKTEPKVEGPTVYDGIPETFM